MNGRERYCYILRRVDPDTLMPSYKIGISYQPRLRAVQCHAELLVHFRGGTTTEKYLHAKFVHLRLPRPGWEGQTEWFTDDDGELAEFLAEVAA